MGNFSNELGNNGDPKETKKVLDDYLEETEAIDLVEDIGGKRGSSLVGLDLPPNFMECNRNKVEKQNVDELNWNADEKQKSKPELSDLAKKVESHSLRAVRSKLVAIIGKVFLFLASIFQRLKQAFYILIIYLMVKDGYR